MQIGRRLRALRKKHGLSQGDLSKRTGLLRTYLSRVENGHTVPALDTLEKIARALRIPLYSIFHAGRRLPPKRRMFPARSRGRTQHKRDKALLAPFLPLLSRLSDRDRKLLLQATERLAVERRPSPRSLPR